MARIYSALDEGFPNRVGEAMNCKVPCVIIDVGDSNLLMGDTGIVGPPMEAGAVVAIRPRITAASDRWRSTGMVAPQPIIKHCSTEKVVQMYRDLCRSLGKVIY